MLQEEDEGLAMAEDETPSPVSVPTEGAVFPPRSHVQGAFSVSVADHTQAVPQSIEVSPEDMQWVGVSGRCNKVADTCYTFWVGGTLGVCSASYSVTVNLFKHVFEASANQFFPADTEQSVSARLQWDT